MARHSHALRLDSSDAHALFHDRAAVQREAAIVIFYDTQALENIEAQDSIDDVCDMVVGTGLVGLVRFLCMVLMLTRCCLSGLNPVLLIVTSSPIKDGICITLQL